MIMVALMAFLMLVLPVSAYTPVGTYINQGARIFIGEEGLNIGPAVNVTGGVHTVAWYAGSSDIIGSSPSNSVDVGDGSGFEVSPANFVGYTGPWYRINPETGLSFNPPQVAFNVADPSLRVSVVSADHNTDVSGTTVPVGSDVTFKINTNIVLDSKRGDNSSLTLDSGKGYVDIVVKSDSGSTYSSLINADGNYKDLKHQFITTTSSYYWNGGVWDIGNVTNGIRSYPNGNYTVYAVSNLNNMNENYKNGGIGYTGKTVSEIVTVKIGSGTLKIESNKDSVVRGKPFAVTITGQPTTEYVLYLKGIASDSTTAPRFASGQDGITTVTSNTNVTITTNSAGQRTIEFTTSSETKEQKYTIRVYEKYNTQKYDEVSVNVAKGGMSLVASGDQTYFLGEEIKFSGTNSESYTTYFFLIGPNLPSNGAILNDPGEAVINGDANTFVDTDVDGDYTYSYDWGTASLDMDAGTYTIYAVSEPVDKNHLSNAVYATTSIVIKKPFVSAHASQGNVAKGDKVFIEGVAEGNPSGGVAIWILGKNYNTRQTESIDSDGTFKYEVSGATTGSMSSGQYFIVVQHPMQNGEFDIDQVGEDVVNLELGGTGTVIFHLEGSGSLQGSDAAEALIQAINDPNIDDTYTKLNILVEEPIIAIDTIGDKQVGDKFTVTGKTNLAVDDEILVEMYSSSFKPTQKSQSGEFSGVTQTVKVVKADSGLNKFSLDVDASSFKADEYIVIAEGIVVDATGTALFNVKEYVATPTPTVVVTAPTAVITAPPTVPPTEVPTEVVTTETTKSPGFGAILALAGLIGVGFIVVRRR
jgi:PGF-CTERM protein